VPPGPATHRERGPARDGAELLVRPPTASPPSVSRRWSFDRPGTLPDGVDPDDVVRGDLHVTGPGGVNEREIRPALGSCGRTANAPYCDGSGTCADWPHPRHTAPDPG
jgi:hypothetical protein